MQRFILTLQFLTRISIAKSLPYDEEFKKGIIYFPFIGLILGFILAAFYKISIYFFDYTITSILLLGIYVFLTGGLHLDGLGDTFDGIYSNRSKERVLEIMKDSRLGTNAVIVIILCLLLKVFGIMRMLDNNAIGALILLPVFGRIAIVYGCFRAKYAREEGMGHIYIGQVTLKEVLFVTVITLGLVFFHKASILFILITILFSYLYKNHVTNIIDGMTGDTLGALCELTEVLYILYILMIVR